MPLFDAVAPAASLIIAFATVVFTTLMLSRQVRQMEHERNALAIIEAIDRLSSPHMVRTFTQLRDVASRYPTDADIGERFPGSQDDNALTEVGQYVETIACLARRQVLDPSLLVDAVGVMLRARCALIRAFASHLPCYNQHVFKIENIEWLARSSGWWKGLPRPARAQNCSERQFAPTI